MSDEGPNDCLGERDQRKLMLLKQLTAERDRHQVLLERSLRLQNAEKKRRLAGNLEERVRMNDDAASASYIPPKKRVDTLSMVERAMALNEAEKVEVVISDDDDEKKDEPVKTEVINLGSDDDEIVIIEPRGKRPAKECVNLVDNDDDDDAELQKGLEMSKALADDEQTRREKEETEMMMLLELSKKDAERTRPKIPGYRDEVGAGCSTWTPSEATPSEVRPPMSPLSIRVGPKPDPKRLAPTRIGDATGATPFGADENYANLIKTIAEEVKGELTRLNKQEQIRQTIQKLDNTPNIREQTQGNVRKRVFKELFDTLSKTPKNRMMKFEELKDEDSEDEEEEIVIESLEDEAERPEGERVSSENEEVPEYPKDLEENEIRPNDPEGNENDPEEGDDDVISVSSGSYYESDPEFIENYDPKAEEDTNLYRDLVLSMEDNNIGVRHLFNKENKNTTRLMEQVLMLLQSQTTDVDDYDTDFIKNDNIKSKRAKERIQKLMEKAKNVKKKISSNDLVSAVLNNDFDGFNPTDDDYISDEDEILVWPYDDEISVRRKKSKGKIISSDDEIPVSEPPFPSPRKSDKICSSISSDDEIPEKIRRKSKDKEPLFRRKSDDQALFRRKPNDENTDASPRKSNDKEPLFRLKSKSKDTSDGRKSDDEIPAAQPRRWNLANFINSSRSGPREKDTAEAPVRSRVIDACKTKKRKLPPSITGVKEHKQGDKNNKYDESTKEIVVKLYEGIPPYEFEPGKTKRTFQEIKDYLIKMKIPHPSGSSLHRYVKKVKDPEGLEKQEKAKRDRARAKRNANRETQKLKELATEMRQGLNEDSSSEEDQ